jgi:hypothetical protein
MHAAQGHNLYVRQTLFAKKSGLVHEETEISGVGCVSSDRAEADHISAPPPAPSTLAEAVELVLAQVDPQEFGRVRLKTVRQTLAVVYGYSDQAAVNHEIRLQESIFAKERRVCWAMQPDVLFVRIEARTTSLTRNVGKRQEGKYRKLLEIADEVRQRRDLVMPERPTTAKPVLPPKRHARAAVLVVEQPDLFTSMPLAPDSGWAVIARLRGQSTTGGHTLFIGPLPSEKGCWVFHEFIDEVRDSLGEPAALELVQRALAAISAEQKDTPPPHRAPADAARAEC